MSSPTDATLPIVLASLPISFLLSFAIGANDVANSFGTSYGSGVLTLRQCCILATIFETLGAVLLGYNVSETIRKGIFDVSCYTGEEAMLSLGYFSALIGSALWNLFATLMKLPVSGTHSILGSLLGFTLVAKHMAGIKWQSIAKVIASWFISPVAAGIISIIGYYFLYKYVLQVKGSKRTELLLHLLPLFFALAVFVNVFSILFKGPAILIPFQVDSPFNSVFAFGMSLLLAGVTWIIIFVVLVPFQEKRLRATVESPSDPAATSSASSLNHTDPPEVASVFKSLQILTSCFGSFAHGANDVSNAIGPLIAVYLIHNESSVLQQGQVPIWLLAFGGCGISAGLWVLGRRVIETIGKDLTSVTPSSGFTIELCSSLTVLTASKLGFPISTTHCKVGSVVATGWIRKYLTTSTNEQNNRNNVNVSGDEELEDTGAGKSAVNWKLLAEIAAAWVLTLPVSAAFSALAFWILRLIFTSYSGTTDCHRQPPSI